MNNEKQFAETGATLTTPKDIVVGASGFAGSKAMKLGKKGIDRRGGLPIQRDSRQIAAIGKFKTKLTDAGTNDIFTMVIDNDFGVGGVIHWSCVATDGSDTQCRTGITTFAAVNDDGTLTTDVDEIGGSIAVSGGTLTGTWSIATSGAKITLRFTPTSSLTTTRLELYYSYDVPTGQVLEI